jgi:hypothetical protein
MHILKTALMAKVASEASARMAVADGNQTPVLIRFCGTSSGSKDARSLMASLCAQLEFVHGLEKRAASFEDQPYDALVAYFQSLLREHSVLLFIDSLDQLTNDNQGRSQLSFLRGVRPHALTRIVVSCLPDEREVDPETGRAYMYLCETRLKEGEVPFVRVEMANAGAADEAMDMLDRLLLQRGRRLQEVQRRSVRERVAQETEKTALYINLAVGVAGQWTSDVDAGANLMGGVRALIEQLFATLERDFGEKLVRTALALLTFSVKGLSDVEMEDLLSLHDAVLDEVFQYAKP